MTMAPPHHHRDLGRFVVAAAITLVIGCSRQMPKPPAPDSFSRRCSFRHLSRGTLSAATEAIKGIFDRRGYTTTVDRASSGNTVSTTPFAVSEAASDLGARLKVRAVISSQATDSVRTYVEVMTNRTALTLSAVDSATVVGAADGVCTRLAEAARSLSPAP